MTIVVLVDLVAADAQPCFMVNIHRPLTQIENPRFTHGSFVIIIAITAQSFLLQVTEFIHGVHAMTAGKAARSWIRLDTTDDEPGLDGGGGEVQIEITVVFVRERFDLELSTGRHEPILGDEFEKPMSPTGVDLTIDAHEFAHVGSKVILFRATIDFQVQAPSQSTLATL